MVAGSHSVVTAQAGERRVMRLGAAGDSTEGVPSLTQLQADVVARADSTGVRRSPYSFDQAWSRQAALRAAIRAGDTGAEPGGGAARQCRLSAAPLVGRGGQFSRCGPL